MRPPLMPVARAQRPRSRSATRARRGAAAAVGSLDGLVPSRPGRARHGQQPWHRRGDRGRKRPPRARRSPCTTTAADGGAATLARIRKARRRRASSFAADVADGAEAQALVEAVIDRFGRLDGLVNNAGRTQVGPFLDARARGVGRGHRDRPHRRVHTCRAALPSMLERGSGSIVNIASRLGQMGIAETAAYCAAKAGLIGLTRSLAREFGAEGVRVNAVAPGVTVTR